MGAMASQIADVYCYLLNHLFRRGSKKTFKLCVTAVCEGNSPVTSEFPSQKASHECGKCFDLMMSSWHWGLMKHICLIELGQLYFREWLDTFLLPSHYSHFYHWPPYALMGIVVISCICLSIHCVADYQKKWMRKQLHSCVYWLLTHWGLVTRFGDIDLSQHWLR